MVHQRHIHLFWDWFIRNARRFENVPTGDSSVCDELLNRLHRVHRGITYELGFAPGDRFRLIISADGRKELFTDVHRIVDAAPRLEGWVITALRPRRELPVVAGLGSVQVNSEEVWFSADHRDGLLDITLFFGDFIDSPETFAVAFLMLDVALGEFDTETKIGKVKCVQAPSDPGRDGLLPFAELAGYVDAVGVGIM